MSWSFALPLLTPCLEIKRRPNKGGPFPRRLLGRSEASSSLGTYCLWCLDTGKWSFYSPYSENISPAFCFQSPHVPRKTIWSAEDILPRIRKGPGYLWETLSPGWVGLLDLPFLQLHSDLFWFTVWSLSLATQVTLNGPPAVVYWPSFFLFHYAERIKKEKKRKKGMKKEEREKVKERNKKDRWKKEWENKRKEGGRKAEKEGNKKEGKTFPFNLFGNLVVPSYAYFTLVSFFHWGRY